LGSFSKAFYEKNNKTALKIIGRRVSEGSTVYTDSSKAYLGEAGLQA